MLWLIFTPPRHFFAAAVADADTAPRCGVASARLRRYHMLLPAAIRDTLLPAPVTMLLLIDDEFCHAAYFAITLRLLACYAYV